MPRDNEIKDLFNNPSSLDNEDWLQPSERVFENITEEVYAVPNKRNHWLIFWLIFGIIITLAFFLLIPGQVLNSSPGNSGDRIMNEFIQSNNLTNQKLPETPEFDIPRENKMTSSEPKTGSKVKPSKPSIKKELNQTSPWVDVPQKQSSNHLHSSTSQIPNIIETSNDQESTTIDLISKGKKSMVNIFESSEEEMNVSIQDDMIEETQFELLTQAPEVNRLHALPLSFDRDKEQLDLQSNILEENRSWKLIAASGYSNWKYVINENLLSALSPFDFTHENGHGAYLKLGIAKSLTERIDLQLAASFAQNKVQSGHNSELTYSLEDESLSSTNEYALTMASPLGFIGSSVVMERDGDFGSESIDFIVDLQNEHLVEQTGLELTTRLNVLDNQRLRVAATFGLSLDYLRIRSNSLRSFTPMHQALRARQGSITADQENIQSFNQSILTGIEIGYKFNNSRALSLEVQYSHGLSPVFELDDFTSKLNRLRIGLTGSHRF